MKALSDPDRLVGAADNLRSGSAVSFHHSRDKCKGVLASSLKQYAADWPKLQLLRASVVVGTAFRIPMKELITFVATPHRFRGSL